MSARKKSHKKKIGNILYSPYACVWFLLGWWPLRSRKLKFYAKISSNCTYAYSKILLYFISLYTKLPGINFYSVEIVETIFWLSFQLDRVMILLLSFICLMNLTVVLSWIFILSLSIPNCHESIFIWLK